MIAAGLGWRDGGGALPVYDRGSESDAIDVITMCLAHGADINAGNDAGDTAMHAVAVRGADDIIKFLAAHGANVDPQNRQGRTQLEVGLRQQDRSPSTVAAVEGAGAAIADRGRSPLLPEARSDDWRAHAGQARSPAPPLPLNRSLSGRRETRYAMNLVEDRSVASLPVLLP
jgi:hypothetical protein